MSTVIILLLGTKCAMGLIMAIILGSLNINYINKMDANDDDKEEEEEEESVEMHKISTETTGYLS